LNVQEIGLLHPVGSDDLVLHLGLSLVCGTGPRTGDIHRDMDPVDLLLRNLFQAGRLDGEATMSATDLLLPAIVVFALLLIGLGLTVLEFRKMK
jgi:hypothetical protein